MFEGGDVIEKLQLRKAGEGDRKSGTTVRVWPDAKYFEASALPMAELTHLLRSKAVLMPGVTVTLVNEKTKETQTWLYKGGLRDYLMQTLPADPVIPLFEGEGFADAAHDSFAEGEGAQWCVAFTEDGQPVRESYVNLIPTSAGGTHESGLRDGLFKAVKSFVELHSLLPKGVKLLPEDVFARASYVLSAKVLDPQFQGQIKERLNSRDAVRLVSSFVRPTLELWLNQHVEYGKKLAELAIKAAQTRQKAGQKVEKRKGSGVAVLPGKLTDCESRDLAHNEVFLVEGDSAGGSAKMGRDKESQAILPLRGKVLNTWEVERDRLFANTEIHDIAVAIGVDPHGPNDTPDLQRPALRQDLHPVSDADVDGSHIQVLLLTLFFRHFPKLIETGHVFVARPPLFRVDAPARGKKPASKAYALDEGELTGHSGQVAQGRRARRRLGDQPLQGPGRNECGTIVGNHTQSGHPPPVAGAAGQPGLRPDRDPDHQADGQGRSRGAARTDGTARRRRGNRYLKDCRCATLQICTAWPCSCVKNGSSPWRACAGCYHF